MQIMLLRQILATNLKKRMEERGMRQKELEARSGISQSHISRIKRMESGATIDVLAAISGSLGCQPWELLIDDEVVRREALERMLGPRPSTPYAVHEAAPAPTGKRVAHKRRAKAAR